MLPIIFRGHHEPGFFAHALGMGRGTSPVRSLSENQPTEGAQYACLIVVKDYFRMRISSGDSREWHYSALEPAILEDVRAGRAVLVFDLSNEGPAYDTTIFGEFYAWIEANRLPGGRCIWLAQNRLMGAAAAAHAGSRSTLVDFEHYDYFVKLMAFIFAQANTAEGGALRLERYPDAFLDVAHKDKLLLCLNATPRLGRVLTIAALLHHQLIGQSVVSFPGMRYVKAGASLADVFSFLERNPALEHLRPWVHVVGRMTPLRVDSFQEQGNSLVEKIDPGAYRRTFFSVVTESDFSEPWIERVTEKTVKSYCMGHPTLIVGNAGSVDIMRSYGFQDWNDVLDRTHDSAVDPTERFNAVIAEVSRQKERIRSDPAAWLHATREVSAHNHRHAVSGDFLRRYVSAFDQRLIDKLKMLVSL